MEPTILKVHRQVKSEFGERIAICVTCLLTINFTLKPKWKDMQGGEKNKSFSERIVKKFKKNCYLQLTKEDEDLAVRIWEEVHMWDCRRVLDGLGGGPRAATFKEIFAEKDLDNKTETS
jgi:hypothetical protein